MTDPGFPNSFRNRCLSHSSGWKLRATATPEASVWGWLRYAPSSWITAARLRWAIVRVAASVSWSHCRLRLTRMVAHGAEHDCRRSETSSRWPYHRTLNAGVDIGPCGGAPAELGTGVQLKDSPIKRLAVYGWRVNQRQLRRAQRRVGHRARLKFA